MKAHEIVSKIRSKDLYVQLSFGQKRYMIPVDKTKFTRRISESDLHGEANFVIVSENGSTVVIEMTDPRGQEEGFW